MKMQKWKKGMVFLIIGLFIGAGFVPSISSDDPISRGTIYVDDDASPGWYDATHVRTIQEGVDNASSGDTVFVYNGTYYENIVVYKSIILQGENENGVIIDSSGHVYTIKIDSDSVILKSVYIKGATAYSSKGGVYVYESNNIEISNCIIKNNTEGLNYYSCSNIALLNNKIIDNSRLGVSIESGTGENIDIIGNIIYNNGNDQYYGLFISSMKNGNILENNISKNCMGIRISVNVDNITIKSNIINNNSWRGIHIENGINCDISNNIIINNSKDEYNCIEFIHLHDSVISNNIIIGYNQDYGKRGIYAHYSSNNTIRFNQISNFYVGIDSSSSNINNLLYHNKIFNNFINVNDQGSNNWDNGYPLGGNYWDDYAGADNFHGPNQDIQGSDGIGDTVYYIPGGSNQDNYPLMGPWGGNNDWWPMFHHDSQNTGYSKSTAPETNTVLWNYTTGGNSGTCPIVVNRKIYFVSDRLYCLNLDSVNKLWSFPANDFMNCNSIPAFFNGWIYSAMDDKLFCINANTGYMLWNFTGTDNFVFRSPKIVDGNVFSGSSDGNLYCLDTINGNEIWNYSTGSHIETSPSIAYGNVYFGSWDNNLYCIDKDTGNEIWNYSTGSHIETSPAVAYGNVYFGSDDNNVYCLNAITGNKIWSYTTGNAVCSSPAVAYGNVYFGSYDNNVYCLDAITGNKIWNYTTGGIVGSNPAIADLKLYIGSGDNILYCLNAITGNKIWNYTIEADIDSSSPVVADGKLFVSSYGDFQLYCFGGEPDIRIEPDHLSFIYDRIYSKQTKNNNDSKLNNWGKNTGDDQGFLTISPLELYEKINFTENFVLVDVRSSLDYNISHIPTAISIPFIECNQCFIDKIAIYKGNEIIIYSGHGILSKNVCYYLVENGYEQIYNLEGGIINWQEYGFPVETSNNNNSNPDFSHKLGYMSLTDVEESEIPITIDGNKGLPPPPSWWNWRSAQYKGIYGDWTTPVKNQGSCGSCWAFAAVGVLEIVTNMVNNNPNLDYDLSEQYMVSCVPSQGQCPNDCVGGGNAYYCFKYIVDDVPSSDKGALFESCFTYQAIDANGCDFYNCGHLPVLCSDKCANWCNMLVKTVFDYGYDSSVTIDDIKYMIYYHGPVCLDFTVYTDFYDGSPSFDVNGVYEYDGVSTSRGGHQIVAVGYVDTPGNSNYGGYFICKNSWGASWGPWDNGFFGIAYGECNIDNNIVWVVSELEQETSKTITIFNDGITNLTISNIIPNYQTGIPTGWLSTDLTSATILPSESVDITVLIDPISLSDGSYYGWLSVYSNDPYENQYDVTVNLMVISPPVITNIETNPEIQVKDGYVNITCEVTDETDINKVNISIWKYLNGIYTNSTMINIYGTNIYYLNANYSDEGIYDYSICACDVNNSYNYTQYHRFKICNTVIINQTVTGENIINANNSIDMKITINTTSSTNVTISNYSINPIGDLPQHNNEPGRYLNIYERDLVKFLDIHVEDESVVEWPVNITVFYTQDDLEMVSMNENQLLGICYWDESCERWIFYNETGINTSDQDGYAGYTWANAYHLTAIAMVGDATPPEITDVAVYPSDQVKNGYVNITCNVFDNVYVNSVKVNITGPSGFTSVNDTMDKDLNYYYNRTYAIAGIYEYYIWTNDSSENSNKSMVLSFEIINLPPSANFSYIPVLPDVYDSVQFNDTSVDLDGTVDSWSWDFDDGNISYDQHPTHQYTTVGNYTVCLNVTDDDGASDEVCKQLTVIEILNDVNQSTFNRGFPIRHAIDGDWAAAQNFTPTLDTLTSVDIYLRKFGSPEFNLTVELREDHPQGTLLDTVVFEPSEVASSWTWLTVDFDDVNVGVGSDVFIVLPPAPSGVTTSFGYEWGYAFGNQYDNGSFWFTRDGGELWRDLPTMYEFVFRTYGYD